MVEGVVGVDGGWFHNGTRSSASAVFFYIVEFWVLIFGVSSGTCASVGDGAITAKKI